jgi:hypothetical protein
MRHLGGVAPVEVGLLPRRVMESAGFGLLVPTACRAQALAAPELRAGPSAVHVAVIAYPAQKDHGLTTATAHEA